MSISFWEKKHWLAHQDVVIIGSGLTGIQAAIHAKTLHPAWSVTVLERGMLPSGASTKNAGFACYGSPTEIAEDLANIGPDRTFALIERRYRGFRLLREQLGEAALGYQPCGGFELFRSQDKALSASAEAIIETANAAFRDFAGIDRAFEIMTQDFGFGDIQSGIACTAEGQLDPGAMMRKLLAQAAKLGVELRTGWQVNHYTATGKGVELEVAGMGAITASRLIIATNGFARQLLPELALRPVRNQVLITAPIPALSWKGVFHYDRGYVYFRNVGQRILIGGFRNLGGEAEETDQFGLTDSIQDRLESFLKEVILPDTPCEITDRWSGILGVGESREPILEEVAPNVVVAVRLGGMGVALGTLLGREAADLLIA
ncbi:MAG: FAD-binding oxidoreductase [Bacteroidia bacterium]|nr:FAD-binding oxidoreductase [Bacteroidia bacterium]